MQELLRKDPHTFADDIFILKSDPINAVANSGYLDLQISNVKDKVWHVWNTNRGIAPSNSEYLIARSRIKIEGPAYVLMGIDFWKPNTGGCGTNVNNVEAGSTNWMFIDMGWAEIELILQ